MKILLIAGHGAGDPGASGKLDGVTYREADETRNLVAMVSAELQKRKIDVQTFDTARNAYGDYKTGTLKFPAVNYVLEIHFNAVAQSGEDGKTKGVECYVTTTESGIGVETAICGELARLGLTNRGVKKKNFAVISTAKRFGISAALLETCFIDDADDLRLYISRREAFAKAIASGICEGFGIDWKEDEAVGKKSGPSAWAKEACEWAVKKGIFQGDDKGDFRWQDPVTREQLAVVLRRLFSSGN